MSESGLDFFGVIKSFAERGIENQIIAPNDYVGADGLLICGRCGERRQSFQKFLNPTADNPENETELKVAIMCKCERDEKARREQEEQNLKDMERIAKLRKTSLMDEKFLDATFDNFRTNQYNAKALKICKRYATQFDLMVEKNQGLLFGGNVGTGKSFAASCIANYLLDRKVPVVMTSFVKLLDTMMSFKKEDNSIISQLNRAKLLIIDDLGAERGTDTALEKVYNIIDSRYRKRLPMILTTNLTIEEMKAEENIRYTRIYDRIFELCYPLQFAGPSWRKQEAFHRFRDMEKLFEDIGTEEA